MCGIVGYIGDQAASDILVNGLHRLEYRGYDSAGVAILNNGSIQLRRAPGKLSVLEECLKAAHRRNDRSGSHPLGDAWPALGRECSPAYLLPG